MAALLKKRALAEYSQVIQEEPKPVKKLRLQHKPPATELHLDLQNTSSSHDALQVLLDFQACLVSVSGEAAVDVVGELIEHYHREKEAVVRSKIAQVLGHLCRLPGFSPENVIDHLLAILSTEKSHKVLREIIQALSSIGRQLPSSLATYKVQILQAVKSHLCDSAHSVRSSCLDTIGVLWSSDSKDEGENQTDMQKLITKFFSDQDPRVRTSAFQAMVGFHQRGLQLDLNIHQHACQAFTDDYEDVRRAAVKVVWVLCHLYPESLVPVCESSVEELRLVDDGFAKICNMINDISVKVRVEAASLLGSLHQVSPRFLEQTLDKKLMSNMRRKHSAHERAKEHFQSGEWSTGQKWADDAPKEEIDPENINLMNIGACGAFIHGLEDEFYEVRNAALDSLCELAAQSRVFANLSQDSIIDMFNDEIESVRLNAINSLRKISHHIVLRQDQLEIILGVLQDFSGTTRTDLRDMLCDMRLSNKECLNDTVLALLDNLRRYPQDRTSVWKCSMFLGKNHPQLCLTQARELLCIHPYFNTPVPDMDDPAYIAILVLMFNACVDCPTLIPLLQDHTLQHYTYLRDSQPHLVPILAGIERLETGDVTARIVETDVSTAPFRTECLGRLSSLAALDNDTASQLLSTTVRDLKRMKDLDGRVSASAECTCTFLQSQLIITQIMSQMQACVGSLTASDNILAPIDKVLELTTCLQTLFLGLSNMEIGLIKQTELKAITLQLRVILSKSSLVEQFRATEAYKQYLKLIHMFLESNGLAGDNFTKQILSSLNTLDPTKLNSVRHLIQSAIPLIRPVACPTTQQVRKAQVVIHEPGPNVSDTPVKFAAGLTAAIPLDVTVENLPDVDRLKIQVRYPDQQVQLLTPCASDWKKLSPLRHKLQTQVVISHALWSESCCVELNLVLEPNLQGKRFSKKQDLVDLCSPVKVLVSTKPAKR
ncbi:integrator complex subunit 4-like [Haliotis asinina]|uniref:integrator complex subunit 4-like n=1 Tax=Haliotis asinina TaxID=109174 RepID=UPI0035324B80